MGHMKDFDRRIRNGGDDAIAAVIELMPRWIPVSERLPPADGSIVLAYYWHDGRGDGSVWQAVYAEEIGGWRCQDAEECDYGVPTHWMQLPEPPTTASHRESTPGTG
jgi:hypothetical protein